MCVYIYVCIYIFKRAEKNVQYLKSGCGFHFYKSSAQHAYS